MVQACFIVFPLVEHVSSDKEVVMTYIGDPLCICLSSHCQLNVIFFNVLSFLAYSVGYLVLCVILKLGRA